MKKVKNWYALPFANCIISLSDIYGIVLFIGTPCRQQSERSVKALARRDNMAKHPVVTSDLVVFYVFSVVTVNQLYCRRLSSFFAL